MQIIKIKMRVFHENEGEYTFIGYFYNYVEIQEFKRENLAEGNGIEILDLKRVAEMPWGQGQDW